MALLDGVIVELIAKGMLMVAGPLYDDKTEAVTATQDQLGKMSGVMERLQRKSDEDLDDLREKLGEVYESIVKPEMKELKEKLWQSMKDEEDDTNVRSRVVEMAMVLYCLVRNTSIQQVALKVQKVIGLPSSSASRRSIVESETILVGNTTTAKEIISNLLQMNENGLFRKVVHSSDDQMSINVDAAPRIGARREGLIKGTGGLFKLCQTLCDVVQDEREHEDFVIEAAKYLKEDSDVEEASFDEFTEAWEKKGAEMNIKNVYLLGLTGQGKSTLANKLTGTDHFHVSDAGTGTERISGAIAEGGLLGSGSNVMVWDTPGMDDQQGRDRIYESMLYQHLTRENTVSTIIIVSKDGSRFPTSLRRTIAVYRQAFGDAFLSCVCVCVGLNENIESESVLQARQSFWEANLMRTFKFSEEAVRRKVFFYDARSSRVQLSANRLKAFIISGRPHLTGTGVAILQGLKRLQSAQLQDEEKRNMVRVSKEMFKALRTELQLFQRVRIRFSRDSQRLSEKMTLHLLPNIEDRIVSFFRNRRKQREVVYDKVIQIVAKGKRAKQLLSFDYLSHPEMGCHMKIKIFANYADTWDLVLANMGAKPVDTGWGKIQLQTYNLIHLDDQLDKTVFDAVDKLLNVMAIDPKFVNAFARR